MSAIAIDELFGEPKRFHPIVGFGNLANRVELKLNPNTHLPIDFIADEKIITDLATRFRGLIGTAILVVPPVALSLAIPEGILGIVLNVLILYLALARHSLRWHSTQVFQSLRAGDLVKARQDVKILIRRKTDDVGSSGIALFTIEAVVENGLDAIFGVIFWFLVAGAPGVILYRLSNTLDAMWGYKSARFKSFGWSAARLDDILNWIPGRLTAASYAAVGNYRKAFKAWKLDAPRWSSPSSGPVLSAGAGSLGVQIGGTLGGLEDLRDRTTYGIGDAPVVDDIIESLALVDRAIALWVCVLFTVLGLYTFYI